MVKKARLQKEVKIILKSIKILFIVSFIFGFFLFFSYINLEKYSDYNFQTKLFNQKGFDVSLVVRANVIPFIIIFTQDTYVCEGNFIDFPVKVITLNGDLPGASLSIINPFYIIFNSKLDSITNEFRIVSLNLNKNDAGGVNKGSKTYEEIIYMVLNSLVGSKKLNITVIEINNPPVIKNIGVKTIWTRGDNNIFDYQVNVSDIEDGDSNALNLSFNISFSQNKLFNISRNGTMYFKPNESYIGVYNISVCASDRGIKNPHPKILETCNSDGSNLTSCNNFSLTITDENRPPIITNHTPENLSFSIPGNSEIYFNITSRDPDRTIVDTYWYVDNELKKYDTQTPLSNFSFSYICGYSGMSNISVFITDGELNDSLVWNISVSFAACPSDGGGAGGGGAGLACTERWVCESWSECNNLKEDYTGGKVSYKVNTLVSERCKLFNLDEKICGYQIRNCMDLKKCNSNLSIPGIMQECHYIINPSCSDGLKNCHNSSCEVGIDCGGSCTPCPSCEDGIQNQDEEGIDCGGVCDQCIYQIPKSEYDFFKLLMYISLIFLIIALIGITILGIKYIFLRKKLGDIYYEENLTNADSVKTSYKRNVPTKREFG